MVLCSNHCPCRLDVSSRQSARFRSQWFGFFSCGPVPKSQPLDHALVTTTAPRAGVGAVVTMHVAARSSITTCLRETFGSTAHAARSPPRRRRTRTMDQQGCATDRLFSWPPRIRRRACAARAGERAASHTYVIDAPSELDGIHIQQARDTTKASSPASP